MPQINRCLLWFHRCLVVCLLIPGYAMPNRLPQSPTRPTRRQDRRDGYDIADIYEARLLAQGMRSDDFVALRSSTDVPPIPNVSPIPFGRGASPAVLAPIAPVANALPPADAGGTEVSTRTNDIESS